MLAANKWFSHSYEGDNINRSEKRSQALAPVILASSMFIGMARSTKDSKKKAGKKRGRSTNGRGKGQRDAKFEKDIITGLISLILLSVLDKSKKAMYGYQIAKEMSDRGHNRMELKQGTIYPVLRSMEKKGFLKSFLKASESGPPRKYYDITTKGKKKLDIWTETWNRTKRFVDTVLGGGIYG